MTSQDETGKIGGNNPPRKKTRLKALKADIDKDALKVFADAPKMAVTVVSFVTSAGAIMFRLSQSAKIQDDSSFLQSALSTLNIMLFLLGLVVSFWAIVLSYHLISSITACFIEITDENVEKDKQQESWAHIRENEYPHSEAIMMGAVIIWLFVIFLSAFNF